MIHIYSKQELITDDFHDTPSVALLVTLLNGAKGAYVNYTLPHRLKHRREFINFGFGFSLAYSINAHIYSPSR